MSREAAAEADGDAHTYRRISVEGEEDRVPGEFFFATVKAIGTPLESAVVNPLRAALDSVDYLYHPIKLSDRLHEVDPLKELLPKETAEPVARYERLMDAGDFLRISLQRANALAVEAVRHLHDVARQEAHGRSTQDVGDGRTRDYRGVGYLFRSLMHAEEARRLRSLYGSRLFVIAAYYPEDERAGRLGNDLALGDGQRAQRLGEEVARLMRRDAGHLSTAEAKDRRLIENRKFVINVSGTFPHADLFVDARDASAAAAQIERLVQLVFGHPFHTPTTHEIAMAAAYSAAQQSANVARQVGAAIVSADGDLLTTGSNDVPKPGGGVYEHGDTPDYRDHMPPWGHDQSDRIRRGIVRSFLEALMADPSWLPLLDAAYPDGAKERLGERLARALEAPVELEPTKPATRAFEQVPYEEVVLHFIRSNLIGRSEVFDVIEYSRGLHAEMDAITSAARKGLSLKDSVLYCTTLPCHECARLIIASGIATVYFIEPYEKSRVAELYRTEIRFGANSRAGTSEPRVNFLPYVGISPNRFDELFSWVDRKMDDTLLFEERTLDGTTVNWWETARTGKVRRTVVTNDALRSPDRLRDLMNHEETVLAEYDIHYENYLASLRVDEEAAQ